MRRMFVLLAPAVALTMFPTTAEASRHCDHSDNIVLGSATNGPIYIDVRYVGSPYGEMVWIYRESNFTPGLQRGGSGALLNNSEQCQESNTPDLLIF